MKLRIAQRGWKQSRPAETLAEVEVGIGVPWIELIDEEGGCQIRCDRTVSVSFEMSNDVIVDGYGNAVSVKPRAFSLVEVTFALPVELVYVDGDGELLGPAAAFSPNEPVTLAHDSVLPR